ncbi:MAG: PEF-CTERM sorting domain-containing protein [Candidatus Bathyarchaeota archaeon]|nr:PEF-CTERM sorting domain-containing protein [Candidatus Bathyarchaeum tardum]
MRYYKRFLASIALFALVCILFINSVFASSLVMWSQTYGSAEHEVAHWVVETSDNGYVIGGYTRDINDGEYDKNFLMIKTDMNGSVQWNQTYELMEYDNVGSFIRTSDGGFAIVGESSNFWLIKTNNIGKLEWKQTYDTEIDKGRPNSIVQTSDLGYAIAGWINAERGMDVVLIKTDMYGKIEWIRTFESIGSNQAFSLITTSEGGFALVGTVWSVNSSSYDYWLIKTDTNGIMQWSQTYDYDGFWEDAEFVAETADGGYVIGGHANFPPPVPLSIFWIIKTDAYGNVEWNKTYEESENRKVNSVVMTSDEGFALGGVNFLDFWLVKLDSFGTEEWNQTYDGLKSEIVHSIIETSDGGYTLVGEIYWSDAGDSDFWLVKTDELGNIPEFPSWTILPVFLMLAMMVLLFRKKTG